MSGAVLHNYRLLRIAEELCSCHLTDGFCGPENRPDCRCWKLARIAVQGLKRMADPCLADAWPEMAAQTFETPQLERRSHLERLCHAITARVDELTDELAPTSPAGPHMTPTHIGEER